MQRALDSIANENCIAALVERYDLTLADIDPVVLKALEVLVPTLQDHSLWLLGEAGKGKTPLGPILAMLFSRYHGESGSSASELDSTSFVVLSSRSIPLLCSMMETSRRSP